MGAVYSARDQSKPRRGSPDAPCLPFPMLHRSNAECAVMAIPVQSVGGNGVVAVDAWAPRSA